MRAEHAAGAERHLHRRGGFEPWCEPIAGQDAEIAAGRARNRLGDHPVVAGPPAQIVGGQALHDRMIRAGKREAGVEILQIVQRHPGGIIGLFKHEHPAAARARSPSTGRAGAVPDLGQRLIGQRVPADDEQVELAEAAVRRSVTARKGKPKRLSRLGGGAFGIVKAERQPRPAGSASVRAKAEQRRCWCKRHCSNCSAQTGGRKARLPPATGKEIASCHCPGRRQGERPALPGPARAPAQVEIAW